MARDGETGRDPSRAAHDGAGRQTPRRLPAFGQLRKGPLNQWMVEERRG